MEVPLAFGQPSPIPSHSRIVVCHQAGIILALLCTLWATVSQHRTTHPSMERFFHSKKKVLTCVHFLQPLHLVSADSQLLLRHAKQAS